MAAKPKDDFMVPELRAEREKSSLNLQELITLLDGGHDATERKRKICKGPQTRSQTQPN